jgi:hypothetical protein
MGVDGYSSMCDIVNTYPPKREAAARVAEQLNDSACEMPGINHATTSGSVWRTLGDVTCEIASEFSIPGTQHVVERACKSVIRNGSSET